MSDKEKHPYIDKYKLTKAYKFLVIRTFPPAKELPTGVICKEKKKKNRTFAIDYYYGNAATFWGILKNIYSGYSFDSIENIQKWQEDYCIGITDTIKTCKRKDPCSYKDSDLIVEWEDYNHSLKNYILTYKNIIEKLIFTSGNECNNALANFKIIMGENYIEVSDKVVDDLPSPSGGSNISNFNSNENTLGLKQSLYNFLIQTNNEKHIDYVKQQWVIKKKSIKGDKINRIPKNMLTDFKVYKYKQILPQYKSACQQIN